MSNLSPKYPKGQFSISHPKDPYLCAFSVTECPLVWNGKPYTHIHFIMWVFPPGPSPGGSNVNVTSLVPLRTAKFRNWDHCYWKYDELLPSWVNFNKSTDFLHVHFMQLYHFLDNITSLIRKAKHAKAWFTLPSQHYRFKNQQEQKWHLSNFLSHCHKLYIIKWYKFAL